MMSRAERMAHGGAPESGTYFAPAERTPPNELTTRIAIINGSPLVTRLLDVVSGLLAVLDDARQVVAVNDAFLATLGIEDPESVLGLRPGQALHCIHAEAAPAGCGTTPYCRSCGAAVAIVGALGQEQPVERLCVMQVAGDPDNNELVFAIRAQPIVIEGRKYVLLFLQDRTREQRRAALERTFFHDVRNRLTGLLGAVELLVLEGQPSSLVDSLRRSVAYLCKEVEMQEYLMQSKSARYDPHSQPIALAQIVDDVGSYFAGNAAAMGRILDLPDDPPAVTVSTDASLLMRVLCNMILNALEATPLGGRVRFRIELTPAEVSFSVWNAEAIPAEMVHRLFVRNFSTKSGPGRGVGTYSMKLFGEQILGGRISFTTSTEEGTTFTFVLPA